MVVAKLVFLIIMAVSAVVMFVSPLFFPEERYKGNMALRTKYLVRVKLVCFLVALVMLLLCIILK